MQNAAKQNYPGSVTFYHTQPGNKVGLFYTVLPSPHEASVHTESGAVFVKICQISPHQTTIKTHDHWLHIRSTEIHN